MTQHSGTDNESVRAELMRRIQALVPDDACDVSSDPWTSLDYSSCFGVRWKSGSEDGGVFVKIPKADIDRRTVFPESAADRSLGETERASLEALARCWTGDGDGGFTYVRLLEYYPDLNALVTRRAFAHDLIEEFRVEDRRIGPDAGTSELEAILRRLSASLATFHQRSRAEIAPPGTDFTPAAVAAKIRMIAETLRVYGVPRATLDGLTRRLEAADIAGHASGATATLKGLDVRNVLRENSGRVWLLDPGRTKIDEPEADLARLIVTCRILYWGTPRFFGRTKPAARYERALRDGYGAHRDPVLTLFVIKELFRQWRAAYVALLRKRWPALLNRVLRSTYIDSFYAAEIARELDALETRSVSPLSVAAS